MQETKADQIDKACQVGAEWSVRRIAFAIEERDHALIALPGGNSIQPFARALIDALDTRSDLPRERITIFLADERILPRGHTERNDRLVVEILRDAGAAVSHGPYRAPKERDRGIMLVSEPPVDPDGPESTPKSAADRYSREIARAGGTIDLAILGAGEDGHIASLFPNHALTERGEAGYAPITDSPKPPHARITLLPRSITSARAAVVLFFGEGKRAALCRFLARNEQPSELPALFADAIDDRLILTDQIDLVRPR